MFFRTILSSLFLMSLATQSAAYPLNQNDKRASYSVINVDGSNGGSDTTGGFQTATETVTQTITMSAVTVTVTQTPTAPPYDDGLWHPPYYKVVDPSSPETVSCKAPRYLPEALRFRPPRCHQFQRWYRRIGDTTQ